MVAFLVAPPGVVRDAVGLVFQLVDRRGAPVPPVPRLGNVLPLVRDGAHQGLLVDEGRRAEQDLRSSVGGVERRDRALRVQVPDVVGLDPDDHLDIGEVQPERPGDVLDAADRHRDVGAAGQCLRVGHRAAAAVQRLAVPRRAGGQPGRRRAVARRPRTGVG